MPNLNDHDLAGFHLGNCYRNADSEPAGDGCAPDCPRRLHAEVQRLRETLRQIAEYVEIHPPSITAALAREVLEG